MKCLKISAVEDIKKIKEVYDEANGLEQTMLRQLYPDIDGNTSPQSLAIATFWEAINMFWHFPWFIFVYFFLSDALLVLLDLHMRPEYAIWLARVLTVVLLAASEIVRF